MTTGLSDWEVKLFCDLFRNYPGIAEVLLFGSRAKGTHRPASDIDLAVCGKMTELEAGQLTAELDELPLPYRFDVVSLSALRDDAVRDHIERVGVRLYRAEVPVK